MSDEPEREKTYEADDVSIEEVSENRSDNSSDRFDENNRSDGSDEENDARKTRKKKGKKKKKESEEDVFERFDYEVDESVADLADEIKIGRNAIPDSSDEDEDPIVLRDRRIRREKPNKLAIGKAFLTVVEFKEVVLDYALRHGRNVVQKRWEKEKIEFRCGMGGKCKWRVYCSYDNPRQMFVVKTSFLWHSCTFNGKCKILKSPVIGRLFMDKLRLNEKFFPVEIQQHIKDRWKLVSSIPQCQRGRLLALKWIQQEYAQQFAHLRGYIEEIRTCRPIIGLDGTFLKVAVKGVLLTVVGHDANNQIYPIAWAVVQSETADNWHWFVKQIKDLGLEDGSRFVIISDRSKGLLSAVNSELPNAEHRMCVKHIIENLKKNHAKEDMLKPLVWRIAWSYNPKAFAANLENLKSYDLELYNDVMKEQPHTYETATSPMRGPKYWMNDSYRLVTAPPEPELPGRKKTTKKSSFQRIKGKHESPKKKKKKHEVEKLGREGRIIHCSSCGEAGHNAAGCKKFPKEKVKRKRKAKTTLALDEIPKNKAKKNKNDKDKNAKKIKKGKTNGVQDVFSVLVIFGVLFWLY